MRFDAVAVLSGGYIETYSPPTPLGFVKSSGRRFSGFHKSWLTDSVFCSDRGEAVIDYTENADVDPARFRDCVQAGPLLLRHASVVQPHLDQDTSRYQQLTQSNQEQTFICTTKENHVLIGVTDKMYLTTLVEFLHSPAIGCYNAMRLTGFDTSGLIVGDKTYNADDFLFPNAIGIFRRGP